jgi:hypothetical protein
MFDGQISMSHRGMLAQVDTLEREDDRRREARADAFTNQCATLAPQVHEELAIARAKVEAEASRAELARQRAQDQKAADIADFRDDCLRRGGTWRSVSEILAAERGMPPR